MGSNPARGRRGPAAGAAAERKKSVVVTEPVETVEETCLGVFVPCKMYTELFKTTVPRRRKTKNKEGVAGCIVSSKSLNYQVPDGCARILSKHGVKADNSTTLVDDEVREGQAAETYAAMRGRLSLKRKQVGGFTKLSSAYEPGSADPDVVSLFAGLPVAAGITALSCGLSSSDDSDTGVADSAGGPPGGTGAAGAKKAKKRPRPKSTSAGAGHKTLSMGTSSAVACKASHTAKPAKKPKTIDERRREKVLLQKCLLDTDLFLSKFASSQVVKLTTAMLEKTIERADARLTALPSSSSVAAACLDDGHEGDDDQDDEVAAALVILRAHAEKMKSLADLVKAIDPATASDHGALALLEYAAAAVSAGVDVHTDSIATMALERSIQICCDKAEFSEALDLLTPGDATEDKKITLSEIKAEEERVSVQCSMLRNLLAHLGGKSAADGGITTLQSCFSGFDLAHILDTDTRTVLGNILGLSRADEETSTQQSLKQLCDSVGARGSPVFGVCQDNPRES